MVPKVTKRGTSFNGALAYYLHDKKQEGETERTTTDRVEWTATRGFYKDDLNPETAGRVMAATAMDQGRLKREAGVRNTGQKSKGAVYAYSIAWHPDEAGKIDKAEMIKAADESLQAIGAQDRQAIIVAHNDEPHPHVHVIVNLVSQEDGRNLSVHADRNKLSAWGLAYRKERGEEHIYCPARAQKADAIKRKADGEKVDFVAGEKSRPRSSEKDFNQAAAANQNEANRVKDKEQVKDAGLSLQGKSMHHRQDREWVDLEDRYKFKTGEINSHASDAITRAKDQINEQFRPQQTKLHSNHYAEKQAFEKREGRLSGKVENALLAIAHRREIDPNGSRGFMGHAFNFLTSKKARTDALQKLHKVEQRHLSQAKREEIGAAKNAIEADQSTLLSQAGKTYNTERTALIQRQTAEEKELKAKWSQRNNERRRSFDTVVQKAKSKKATPERKVRDEFKQAAKGSKRRRSKGRSRKRTRD
ncbi:MAG: relaxase/mobilization nuclease domain-containing protein [Flavobacteriaceae bacterium]|nr:relaxase/mobilization nuclease domain-containing protein [Flavobacteriaceae bacterium]